MSKKNKNKSRELIVENRFKLLFGGKSMENTSISMENIAHWILCYGSMNVHRDGIMLNTAHLKSPEYDEETNESLLNKFRGHILVFSISYKALPSAQTKDCTVRIGISDGSTRSVQRTNERSGILRVAHQVSYDATMIQAFIDTTENDTAIKILSASLDPWSDKIIQESIKE